MDIIFILVYNIQQKSDGIGFSYESHLQEITNQFIFRGALYTCKKRIYKERKRAYEQIFRSSKHRGNFRCFRLTKYLPLYHYAAFCSNLHRPPHYLSSHRCQPLLH